MFTARPRQAIGIASAKWIGDRREETADGFVADQQRDHCQDDGAGEAGEVAELAGAEGEAWIIGVPAGIGVGERREQERAGMGAHVQAVGDERDRAEQQAADDLGDHHRPAEPDHRPRLALALLVSLAEEYVAVERRAMRRRCSQSWRSSFEIGADNFEQLLRRFGVQRIRVLFGIDEMRAHVVLDDFGHQTGHGPADSGDQVHHLFAASFAVERALDGLDLAPDAAHAGQQLLLFADGMGHVL